MHNESALSDSFHFLSAGKTEGWQRKNEKEGIRWSIREVQLPPAHRRTRRHGRSMKLVSWTFLRSSMGRVLCVYDSELFAVARNKFHKVL